MDEFDTLAGIALRPLGRVSQMRLNPSIVSVYGAMGHGAEEIPRLEQTLVTCKRSPGPGHPDTLAIQERLAVAYQAARRFDEAITVFGQALADAGRVLGPDEASTISIRSTLMQAYEA